MREVPKLSDADVVFPANPPLPTEAEIPEEFWSYNHPLNKLAQALFSGAKHGKKILIKRELDAQKDDVRRAISACLGTFSCKHEHKLAGVAFLLNEWCDITEAE